jgi:hypothetical protein
MANRTEALVWGKEFGTAGGSLLKQALIMCVLGT